MSLFKKPTFLAVTLGHFAIDVFNSSAPVLITFLSVPLSLSAAQIGFAAGAYQFFAGATQPLFGWLDDKVGSRWLGPGSVAWTIVCLLVSVFVAQATASFYLFLVPFVLASVGSSAFHPLGTKHAADARSEKAATGTAVFFLFGQMGLASGPVLAGFILDHMGAPGYYGLALFSLPVLVLMMGALWQAVPQAVTVSVDAVAAGTKIVKSSPHWAAIIALALIIGLRSWPFIGTVTFLPKLFQDFGWNATAYGSITGAFWLASAITGVFASSIADRWGRRPVLVATLFSGSIALFFVPLSQGWMAFPLVMLSGGLLGASHSILVVIAQNILPGGKSFVSGLTLGYLFGTGAIAAWFIGVLADTWSLGAVIQIGPAFSIVAALLVLLLPVTASHPPPPQPVPASSPKNPVWSPDEP